jgi:hypothetical protein
MYLLKVVIAATGVAQPVIPPAVQPGSSHAVQGWIPQNNGTHTMYLGDAAVTVTNSIQVLATGILPSFPAIAYAMDLNELYVIGTAADILNIMVFP